ncbi:hypothetical protein [Pseudomonas citronellolis]|uniref:hypothetical protein n=1 Tax=Pseudomonas citronellolis TaxID=53408 RepID=UPI0011C0DFF8|nr:hypothetical protein [Pseudomonas citronellolis]
MPLRRFRRHIVKWLGRLTMIDVGHLTSNAEATPEKYFSPCKSNRYKNNSQLSKQPTTCKTLREIQRNGGNAHQKAARRTTDRALLRDQGAFAVAVPQEEQPPHPSVLIFLDSLSADNRLTR